MLITNENWQSAWRQIPVKADSTHLEIFKLQTPSISSLNAGTGDVENGITTYEFAILGLLEYFGEEWHDRIRDVAETMFSEYHYWTFADLKHFIAKVKGGSFGKIYGKFSPAHFIEFAQQYENERALAFSSFSPKKEPEPTGIEYVSKERMNEAFKDFISQWIENIQDHESDLEKERKEKMEEYRRRKMEALKQYCSDNELDFDKVVEEYDMRGL